MVRDDNACFLAVAVTVTVDITVSVTVGREKILHKSTKKGLISLFPQLH